MLYGSCSRLPRSVPWTAGAVTRVVDQGTPVLAQCRYVDTQRGVRTRIVSCTTVVKMRIVRRRITAYSWVGRLLVAEKLGSAFEVTLSIQTFDSPQQPIPACQTLSQLANSVLRIASICLPWPVALEG